VSALLNKMFDGDRNLPVLTSGNCVIKGRVISGLWNYRLLYVRFLTFFTYFSNFKNTWLFTYFWVGAHILEHCIVLAKLLGSYKWTWNIGWTCIHLLCVSISPGVCVSVVLCQCSGVYCGGLRTARPKLKT